MMKYTLPAVLIDSIVNDFKIDPATFIAGHQTERTTAIRFNPKKKPADFLIDLSPVAWSEEAFYLNERYSFTLDPLFHAGCYYVQEASSIFIEHAIKAIGLHAHPLKALDLCAAPGGKSTLLTSTLHPDSLIVANEVHKTRAGILADNLTKWGFSNTIVSNNDPVSFKKLPHFFDLLLIDAPCSGSGMFRKDPETISKWSEKAVVHCSARQKRILSDSLDTLSKNGILIYSTCSYSKMENEDITDWICETYDMEPIRLPLADEWGIVETISEKKKAYGYRFYPHQVKGEGFFISCFVKRSGNATQETKKLKKEPAFSGEELLKEWINTEDHSYFMLQEDCFSLPKHHRDDFQSLQNVLYLKKAGVRLGKLSKKELIPHHELALSTSVHSSIPKVELTKDQALDYLRKKDIQLEINHEKSWVLACYNTHALGWMKILPGRINNYFPKDWRIRHL